MAKSQFRTSVATLLRAPGSRRTEHRRGSISGLEVSGSHVPAGAEVDVDVVLEALQGGAVIAQGTVSAPWEGECVRCLRLAQGELKTTVRELFESDADGEEVYPLAGDQVDLEPLARDAVLLELPLVPLCRADCQGLCSTCGAPLDEGGCECERQDIDPRWAALDGLYAAETESPASEGQD